MKLMSTLGMGTLIYFSGGSVNSTKCVTANKVKCEKWSKNVSNFLKVCQFHCFVGDRTQQISFPEKLYILILVYLDV